jgi:hypothetical protein
MLSYFYTKPDDCPLGPKHVVHLNQNTVLQNTVVVFEGVLNSLT